MNLLRPQKNLYLGDENHFVWLRVVEIDKMWSFSPFWSIRVRTKELQVVQNSMVRVILGLKRANYVNMKEQRDKIKMLYYTFFESFEWYHGFKKRKPNMGKRFTIYWTDIYQFSITKFGSTFKYTYCLSAEISVINLIIILVSRKVYITGLF